MLNYLNDKFINFTLKTKIQLYLLPLMLIYAMYYFSQTLFNNDELFKNKKNITIDKYHNKKFDGSLLDLLNKIEKSAKQLDMQVLSLNHKNNIIKLKVLTKTKYIAKLINIIENINHFTKISSFSINEKNDMNIYAVDLTITVNKYYHKTLKKNEDIIVKKIEKKVIKKEKPPILKEIGKTDYELKAIIANYVLINDIWLKKGEKIDAFELIHINRSFVFLKTNERKLKLELKNEEYLKKIH